MCLITGITMAGVATALSVVSAVAGTAFGVISSIQQGKAQQAQYNYQAEVARENAKIAETENNAAMTRQQGIEEERLQRLKTMHAVGAQQAAMAANGIDVTQGTPLDVVEDTAAMGELDALQTRYNYERQALSQEAEANNFRNQANLDIIAGKNAYSAGKWNAAGQGLAGLGKVGDVASKWYGYSGNNDNSFGTTLKHVGSSISNKFYDLTHGVKSGVKIDTVDINPFG